MGDTGQDRTEPVAAGSHRGRVFRGETVVVDGGEFRDCAFENCRLVYRGGAIPVISGCRFHDCGWSFAEAAANTLAMLAGLNQGGFTDLIGATLEGIRSGAALSSAAEAPVKGASAGRRERVIDLGFGVFPVPRIVRRGPQGAKN
ncbi:hypothetical protein [Stappia sp.]|uniref:hypothetical protein n=1 Tax=Stappia sp. TaxID=1870903 RepID=UPI003A99B527